MTPLSMMDQQTECLITGLLTACLTNWLRAYWVMHLLTKILCDWLHCQRTDQSPKWFTRNVSLVDWLITDYLPGTYQLTKWYACIAGWLTVTDIFCPGTDQLTKWFMAGCLKEKLTPLSWNWPNNWIIYGRFIDRITDSPVRTDQHTEWFIAGWLTE